MPLISGYLLPKSHLLRPLGHKKSVLRIIFLFLMATGVLQSLGLDKAMGAYSFFRPPLKLVSCELMLKGKVRQFKNAEPILASIRDLQYQLRDHLPWIHTDGISYHDVFYNGAIQKLPDLKSELIMARLNGIEESLTKTNLDVQMSSFEIRGDDIKKALEVLEEDERAIAPTYKDLVKKRAPYFQRMLFSYFNLFILGFSVHSLADLSQLVFSGLSGGANGDMISTLVPAFFLLSWSRHFRAFINYEKLRFDSYYVELKDALNKAAQGKNAGLLYSQSTHFLIPVEFHQMLMDKSIEGLPSENSKERELAVWEYAPTYTQRLFMSRSELAQWHMQRLVKNGGELYRFLFLDHFIYFDERANEPVWVFFYRAHRTQPFGRKPKGKESSSSQKENMWSPAWKPVPVRVPSR